MSEKCQDYDQVLSHVGEFGRFQKRVFALACLAIAGVSWPMLYTIFIMDQAKHRCAVPGYPEDTYTPHSAQHLRLLNATVPRDPDGSYSACVLKAFPANSSVVRGNLTDDDVSNTTVTCSSWVYDGGALGKTLTEELDMVCDNAIMRSHSYLAMFLGLLLSSVSSGFLSDRYGRKFTMMLFLVGYTAATFASAFISSFISLIVIRFVVAFMLYGTYVSIFVLSVELVGPRRRSFLGSGASVSWVCGALLVAPLAYVTQHWQTLTLVLSAPNVLFLSYYCSSMPVSCLGFLLGRLQAGSRVSKMAVAKGRQDQAREVILKMARVNGVELQAEVLERLKVEEREETPQASPLQLFSRPRTAIRYSILFFNWAVVTMVYYGLTLNISNLSGDIYVNYVLSLLVELAGTLISLAGLARFGSKVVFSVCLLTSGLAGLATIIPLLLKSQGLQTAMVVLSLVGRFAISGAFNVAYIYTAELYPTVLRNLGLGLSSMCARLGSFLSPYIADLGLLLGGGLGSALPLLVFGGCAVGAGLLSLLLPSTHHVRLPETVQDAWDFGRWRKTSASEAMNGKEQEMLEVRIRSRHKR